MSFNNSGTRGCGQIKCFVILGVSVYALVRVLRSTQSAKNYFCISHSSVNSFIVPVEPAEDNIGSLQSKCVFMSINGQDFLCQFPNHLTQD